MSLFDLISDSIHDLLGGTTSTNLADLGADPDLVTPGGPSVVTPGVESADLSTTSFPNASGSSVIDQVNQSMATATQAYREGMELAENAPTMPGAGEQAQSFINGVMASTPEQLAATGNTLGGLTAGAEISNDVGEFEQDFDEREAAHQAKLDADRALIYAQSVGAATDG